MNRQLLICAATFSTAPQSPISRFKMPVLLHVLQVLHAADKEDKQRSRQPVFGRQALLHGASPKTGGELRAPRILHKAARRAVRQSAAIG